MMSLIRPSFGDVVKRQYQYKLKAYSGMFMTLVLLQLLGIFFSFSGVGSSGTGSHEMSLNVTHYSAVMVLLFTFLWGFVSSILITTRAYRNDDFLYVANRVSSHIANGLFLLTASIIAGITAMLSGYLLKAILYFIFRADYVEGTGAIHTAKELFIGMSSSSLYVLLFCALGYFIGTLVQLHRMFIIVVPAVFFGDLILHANNGEKGIFFVFYEQFFTEPSFIFFLIKMYLIIGLLFIGSLALSNRMEVR
ncbi:hypothetical protein GN156_07840 [bacterium LRH843]|nr:hypothetical protein [bacterium LRH843]